MSAEKKLIIVPAPLIFLRSPANLKKSLNYQQTGLYVT